MNSKIYFALNQFKEIINKMLREQKLFPRPNGMFLNPDTNPLVQVSHPFPSFKFKTSMNSLTKTIQFKTPYCPLNLLTFFNCSLVECTLRSIIGSRFQPNRSCTFQPWGNYKKRSSDDRPVGS